MHPILYPEMALIQKMSPSEGERSILNFLWKTLSSDYEVYYKPFINGNTLEVGSINSIFYFLHKAAEPFNCLEQDNLA